MQRTPRSDATENGHRRWVVALGLTGLFAAGTTLAQQKYLPAEVEAGARLYQSNCTFCHGPEGDGIATVNFSKGQFRRAASDDDLIRVIVRGVPGTAMPPSSFSEGQVATIVAYLRSMSASGGASLAGDAGRGRTVFAGTGQCTSCHAVGGAGSRTGPALTEVGSFRPAAELQRSLVEPDAEIRAENRSVRAVTREGTTINGRLLNQDTFSVQLVDSSERLMSIDRSTLREFTVLKTSTMPSYRDKLSAQELADLVSYLTTLRGRP